MAVVSRDGQGGALLREVEEKFENDTTEVLGTSYLEIQSLSAVMTTALTMCTRGEVSVWALETDFKLGTQSRNGQWWNRPRRWRGSYHLAHQEFG